MRYLLAIAALLMSITLLSQEHLSTKELTLRIGVSHTAITDQRLSAVSHNAWAPKYGISYGKVTTNSLSQLDIRFSMPTSPGNSLLRLRSIRPSVNYSYQRQVRPGVWLGGALDHMTLLNFPVTDSGLMGNNPISYNISQSLGPILTYTDHHQLSDGGRLSWRSSIQTPLITYLIQPAYGHPYPDKYLEDGTFSPTRDGMVWPLVKSGKLLTIDKLQSFRVQLGFYYHVNDSMKIGLDYQADVLHTRLTKSLSVYGNDIALSATYIH